MSTLTGSCLCGLIAYKIEGKTTAFYHCHCLRCRKTTGTSHASNIREKTCGIEWLKGEQLIKIYKVPEANRFKMNSVANVVHRCHPTSLTSA